MKANCDAAMKLRPSERRHGKLHSTIEILRQKAGIEAATGREINSLRKASA